MAQAVFDFAGYQSSLDLAANLVGVGGDIRIVGLGPGSDTLAVGFFRTPSEVSVSTSYWGSRSELIEVIALASSGSIEADVETFPLAEVPEAYEWLRAGSLAGRAVITFDSLSAPQRERAGSAMLGTCQNV